MGTVSKHNVQKNRASRLVINRFLHTFNSLCRVDHRMRLALRIGVVTEIHDDIAIKLKHISFDIFRRYFDIHGVLDEHRRFIRQRPT